LQRQRGQQWVQHRAGFGYNDQIIALPRNDSSSSPMAMGVAAAAGRLVDAADK